MTVTLSPRALMSLLVNGPKAVDVLETALALGLLDALEPGPVRLDALATRLGVRPLRLYKFLDCLESLGCVTRHEPGDDIAAATLPGGAGAAGRRAGGGRPGRDRTGPGPLPVAAAARPARREPARRGRA